MVNRSRALDVDRARAWSALRRWIGGDPWQTIPLHGATRWSVVLIGIGSLLAAFGLAVDPGSVVNVEGWQYATPATLTIGGTAALCWAWRPEWRTAYAVAGSVLGATFLVRSALAVLTLVAGTGIPWATLAACGIYLALGIAILALWRHLGTVIRPVRPPETPPMAG